MPSNPQRTYHYHASAHVLSGRFHRPVEHFIEVQGATFLPTIGGHGSARIENFQLREFVSLRKGYTHVSGSKHESEDVHTTVVTAALEGLNILDVVTADRIVARLASSHNMNDNEPRITMVGTKFENLRIAGSDIHVEVDTELFERIQTFEDATKEFHSNAEFCKMVEDPFKTGKPVKKPEAHGVFLCSCVKEMKTSCPGVKRVGHCFVIPEFGKVFLGEVLLRHAQRTLTMLRFELGSPVSGDATLAQVFSNGRTWP